MNLYLAADHAGFALKDRIKAHLTKAGHTLIDVTPVFKDSDDYPSVADALVKRLMTKDQGRKGRDRTKRTLDTLRTMGILFCGSGVGVCIAANRHKGIRAAVGYSPEEVKLAREHNDINVLCLAGWNHADEKHALKLIAAFLKTKRSAAARHLRRIKQLG